MLNTLIIVAANYLFLLLPLIALLWFLRLPRPLQKEIVVIGLITGALALILGRLIAKVYFDPRPFVSGHFMPLIPHEPDNGFPSDHTLLSSAIAMTVALRDRPVGAVLWVLAILVGVGRIASGLHSVTDVIGSFLLALGAGLVADRVARRIFRRI
jgi:undecaprenyl-diphosphatase